LQVHAPSRFFNTRQIYFSMQAIIKAILAGERDPHKLAAFRAPRVKASEEQIARYLEGRWQEELLFLVKQEQQAYELCQQQIAACDRELEH
jgi:transposase